MITVRQDPTSADYRRAAFLHLRPRPVIAIAGILILALFLLALGLKLATPNRWDRSTFVLLGLLLYLVLYFFVLVPQCANRSFVQNRFRQDHGQCDIDDTGLHTRSDLGAAQIPWDHLHKWKEGRSMVLLYLSDTLYLIFPKRLFKSESWNEFRALAEKNLQKVR
jgi:hypothetical protein